MTASRPASRQTAASADIPAAIENWIGGIAASRHLSALTIILVVLVVFLPGLVSIGALDRDEPYFATIARHMAETGDYVAPVGGYGIIPPVAVLWLQAAAVDLFGGAGAIWVYRIPSLFAAIAAALGTWWMALAFGRPRAALLAALIFGLTPLLVAEAHLAKADALLLAAIVAAQGVLARLWLKKTDRPRYALAAIFWGALLVGILCRAIPAIAAIGLTTLTLCAYSRSAAWLRGLAPLVGLVASAALLVALAAILLMSRGDTASLLEGFLFQADYKAPPGSYAVLFYPLFGPAGVFAALALPAVAERVRRPVFAFAIACVVPYWLLVELLPEKLPPYILPAYPALALLAGTAVDETRLRITGWVSTYFALNLTVWPVLVSVGAVALFYVSERSLPFGAIPFFLAAIVAGAYSLRWLYRNVSLPGSAALALLATALVYIGLFGVILPGMDSLRVASRLVAEAREMAPCEKPLMVVSGNPEPGLMFEGGTGITVVSPAAAANFLAEEGCRVALVEARRQAIFNQRVADLGLDVEVKGSVRGFTLGAWKTLNMRIFMRSDGQ